MSTREKLFGGQSASLAPSPGRPKIEIIAAALQERGFSVEPPLPRYTTQAELDMLTGLLKWDADSTRIQEWLDDRRDALNEDLSRILLGEPPA
jgi:hypothetical protein